MGVNLASTDAAFGLKPYGPILSTQLCVIATNPTPAYYAGHMVEHAGTTLATPYGQMTSVAVEETGAAGSIMGAILALFDSDYDPVKYIAASTTGDSTIAGYALVADHPKQLYTIQEDGDTSSLVIANMGLCADCTGVTGTTSTGQSLMELDSDTIATTNTLALRVLKPHPDDTISSAGAAGTYCRFIVQINSAWNAANIDGV